MSTQALTPEERIGLVFGPEPIIAEAVEPPPINLPDAFWEARPILACVRQAAHARSISADALLGVVLARVCAGISPEVRLPPIIGSDASLNTFVALVGPSGSGKSSSVACGRDLVPLDGDGVRDGLQVGSGEGLIEAFLGLPPEGQARAGAKVQVVTSVLAVLDEGEALAQQAGRRGATILPTLRTAWSGGSLGQANATADRRRHLRDHSYRLAAIIGYQPEHGATLLADDASGTPQRFVWLSATDPAIPEEPPPWPGAFDRAVVSVPGDGLAVTRHAGLDVEVEAEIRQRGLAQRRGEATERLDAHGDLVRLKVAALLAHLDERHDIDRADWDLAGMVADTSRAVRGSVASEAQIRAAATEKATTDKAVRRQEALQSFEETKAREAAVRQIAKRVHREGHASRRELQQAMASRLRQHITVEQAIEIAIERRMVVSSGDGEFRVGPVRPG